MAKTAEWVSRVEAWRASGMSAAEFCKGKEYSAKGLQWWVSHLRRESTKTPRSDARAPTSLVRVTRSASAATANTSAVLVVQLDGARVEVPAGADPALLSTVFEALRRHRVEAGR